MRGDDAMTPRFRLAAIAIHANLAIARGYLYREL